MNKYILIEADTNDGDYISKLTEIYDEELELIKPVIQAIKEFKPYIGNKPDYWNSLFRHNYPTSDCCRKNLGEKTTFEMYGHLEGFDLFGELIPYEEYGIHTIKSIKIIQILEKLL